VEIWLDRPSNPKKWIQRFGRILRQPGDKKIASLRVDFHENPRKKKFLTVKKDTERIYKFAQKLKSTTMPFVPKGQRTLLEYRSLDG